MNPGQIVVPSIVLVHLLAISSPPPDSSRQPFMRPIAAHSGGESCAALDATVFAHATPTLKDLRLSSQIGGVPYTVMLSEAAEPETVPAPVLRLKNRPMGADFDIEMPHRPYTDVTLDLSQKDFILTATVSGKNDLSSTAAVPLGTFTLFDLTAHHLSRSTVLPLQESEFRYLHVELRGSSLPAGTVQGAQVPPSREAQVLYIDVAKAQPQQQGSATIATFQVPAHVPVERIRVELSPRYARSFNRTVQVTGQVASGDPIEIIDGAISQVNLGKIHESRLGFPAAIGANLQRDAMIKVTIENGSEPPLPISAIKLQMRQRSICFPTTAAPLTLFYGDPTLSAPGPAAATRHSPQDLVDLARLGPEIRNPDFVGHLDARSLPERRPDLLWFLLLAVVGAVGTLLLRTLRRR